MLHDCVKPRSLTGQNISICLFVWLIEMISALDCFAFCALLDYLEKYQKVQINITQWRNAIETAIILQLCRIALIVILWDSLLETSDKWMWQKIWRFKLIWDRIHLDSNLRNSTHFSILYHDLFKLHIFDKLVQVKQHGLFVILSIKRFATLYMFRGFWYLKDQLREAPGVYNFHLWLKHLKNNDSEVCRLQPLWFVQ